MEKIIVADPDRLFRDIIAFMLAEHFHAKAVQVESVDSIARVIEANADARLLIIDSSLALVGWETISPLLSARTQSLKWIATGELQANQHLLSLASDTGLPLEGIVEKPRVLEPLLALVRRLLNDAGGTAVPPPLRPHFIPVSHEIFTHIGKSPVDLYLQASPGKFVRILKEQDAISDSPLKALHDDKARVLYVADADATKLAAVLSGWLGRRRNQPPSFEPRLDFPLSVRALDTIRGLYSALGLSAEVQENVRSAVQLVLEQLKAEPKLAPFLDLLRNDPESYIATHSLALAYITCGVSAALGWGSDFTLRKLALASLLHDLSLESEELGRVRTAAELAELRAAGREADAVKVENHGAYAAELIRALGDYPLGADIVVSQHHQLPEELGFPSGAAARKIEPLSALFIVSHDFIDRVLGWNQLAHYRQAVTDMSVEYKRQPFGPIFGAFRCIIEAAGSTGETRP